MALTNPTIRNTKAENKPLKLFDGAGLFLLVTPTGGKWWRFKYRFGGKEKLLSLGTYPQVSLKEARELRDEAKKLLRNNIDPSLERKAAKLTESGHDSFATVAHEWFSKMSKVWVPRHSETIIKRLESYVFPSIGKRPINSISAPELLAILRKLEARGTVETAHRVKQICGQVFRYAIATGRAERDPSADLKGALTPAKAKHMASITDPSKVGGLLRAIDSYQGTFVVKCALKLAPLLFVRPGELRHAEWQEFDLDRSEWRIPAEKMKMKSPHIIPLSKQAVSLLREIHPLTGNGKYVFPSIRTNSRPMSDNTILAALRRMGFPKDEMSGHGFRAMASTILHEQGWPSAIIERQLAHQERNKVKAAYNHAEHLPERKKMMQAWANYLDALKQGAEIIPLHVKATGL